MELGDLQFSTATSTSPEAYAEHDIPAEMPPLGAKQGFDAQSFTTRRAVVSRDDLIEAVDFACRNMVETWNRVANALGENDLDLTYHEDFKNFGGENATLFTRAYLENKYQTGPGYIGHVETIEAVIRAISHLSEDDPARPHVALQAAMQSGKSGFIVLLAMLMRLQWLRSGVRGAVTMMPYSALGPSEELRTDFLHACSVYGPIMFEGGEQTLFSANGRGSENLDAMFVRRNTKVGVEAVIKNAIDNNLDEVLIIIDEADHATAQKSVIGTMLSNLRKQVKVRLVLVSATPYEFAEMETCQKIIMEPGKGYRGVHTGLHICAITRIARMLDLPRLEKFDVSQNGGKDPYVIEAREFFLKLAEGVPANPLFGLNGLPFNGGSTIVARYGSSAQSNKLFNKLTNQIKRRGLNIDVIRFYGSHMKKITGKNGAAATMKDVVASTPNPKIVLLTGSGRRADRFPAECTFFLDFTKKYTTAESFYQGLIGRACGYKPDNIVVMVSDTNMDVVERTRDYFKANGIDTPQIKSMRGYMVQGEVRRTRVQTRESVLLSELRTFDPVLADQIEARVQQSIGNHLTIEMRNERIYKVKTVTAPVKTGVLVKLAVPSSSDYTAPYTITDGGGRKENGKRQAYHLSFHYLDLLGGMPGVRRIEQFIRAKLHADAALLLPGEVRDFRDKPSAFMEKDGHIKISVGNFLRSGHQGGADVAMRRESAPATRGTTNRGSDKNKALVPEILFEPVVQPDGSVKGELRSITFWFREDIIDKSEMHTGEINVQKPGKKTCWFQWGSDNDRKQVEEQMAADELAALIAAQKKAQAQAAV